MRAAADRTSAPREWVRRSDQAFFACKRSSAGFKTRYGAVFFGARHLRRPRGFAPNAPGKDGDGTGAARRRNQGSHVNGFICQANRRWSKGRNRAPIVSAHGSEGVRTTEPWHGFLTRVNDVIRKVLPFFITPACFRSRSSHRFENPYHVE